MRDYDGTEIIDGDLIPKRRRGRPMKPIHGALEHIASPRADTPKCRECPKHDMRRLWCPIRAAPESGLGPACRYGMALIVNKRRTERRNNGK